MGDPIRQEAGYLNPSIDTPISNFFHGLGWSAPNATYNTGADLTLTATTDGQTPDPGFVAD